MKNKKVVAYSS